MPSNFDNIKNSGRSCVGCGRDVSQVPLRRIRSASRSLACLDCYIKHPEWKLAAEADRQLSACVGMPQRTKICNSYGANLGKCGRLIFANGSGELSRLCDKCEREWMQQNIEQDREMAAEFEDEKMVH